MEEKPMNNHNEENTIRDWLDQLHGLISEAGNVSNKIDSVEAQSKSEHPERLQILLETIPKTITDNGKDGYDAAEDFSARCLQIINAVIVSPLGTRDFIEQIKEYQTKFIELNRKFSWYKIRGLKSTIDNGDQNPDYCALCFRIPTDLNKLRTTRSHMVPRQLWKLAGFKYVFDDSGGKGEKGIDNITATKYFICKHRTGKKDVYDCEQAVLKHYEDSLANVFGSYICHKLSEEDTDIHYDTFFFGGLCSVLYRLMLQHSINGSALSNNIDEISELLSEMRHAFYAPEGRCLPCESRVKLFIQFLRIPDFCKQDDDKITGDQWLRKTSLRTFVDYPAKVSSELVDCCASVAFLSGIVVVCLTFKSYQYLLDHNCKTLDTSDFIEIFPTKSSLTLPKNAARLSDTSCWVYTILKLVDSQCAEMRQKIGTNWVDEIPAENPRSAPVTSMNRVVIVPKGMHYNESGILVSNRKQVEISHGVTPGGKFKVFEFTGDKVPQSFKYLVIIEEGLNKEGIIRKEGIIHIYSWYFYKNGDSIKFDRVTRECLRLEDENDNSYFDELEVKLGDSVDKMLFKVHCLNLLENTCMTCKTTQKILRCNACKTATYCSKECQRNDWKKHKHVCNKK